MALAVALASASGADVSLLNAYPTALFPIRGMTDRQTEERLAEKTLQYERRRWGIAASVHTTSDFSVPRALTRHAARWKADLIVVGSGGKTPEGHASISSRCRQLLGSGRFGLAIARRGMAEGGFQLRRIGVGYDGGPESEFALDVAAGLARGAHAELRVLTVTDDGLPVLSTAQWLTLTDEDLESSWESQRRQASEHAEQAVQARHIRATVDSVRGDPARRLREFTRQLDLLVLGSRRWGAVARVVAGSVGEALVRDSACSLLLVPRPSRARDQRVRSGAVEQTVVQ